MYESTFIIEGKPVTVVAVNMGLDLSISVSGGDRPHIGAVALAISRPSLSDSDRTSATTSVLAITGHKEDELAKMIAHGLASSLSCNVSVSCGIHMNKINPDILTILQKQVELEIMRIGIWYEALQ